MTTITTTAIRKGRCFSRAATLAVSLNNLELNEIPDCVARKCLESKTLSLELGQSAAMLTLAARQEKVE